MLVEPRPVRIRNISAISNIVYSQSHLHLMRSGTHRVYYMYIDRGMRLYRCRREWHVACSIDRSSIIIYGFDSCNSQDPAKNMIMYRKVPSHIITLFRKHKSMRDRKSPINIYTRCAYSVSRRSSGVSVFLNQDFDFIRERILALDLDARQLEAFHLRIHNLTPDVLVVVYVYTCTDFCCIYTNIGRLWLEFPCVDRHTAHRYNMLNIWLAPVTLLLILWIPALASAYDTPCKML